ncbi:MAG: GTPase Era [Clostridia bacterium]|nr:GTPase Era [Clostridia bacterium]
MQEAFKSGFVSIIGRPNVGKSTLINRLVGEKIAIISSKPQTTRNNILGILTEDNMQIVFTDTPGIHEPSSMLAEMMVKSANEAMKDTDAILFLVEPIPNVGRTEEKIIESLKKQKAPVILIINKIDTVQKDILLSVISKYTEKYDFAAVIPISARRADGIDAVKEELIPFLNEGPQYFPEDMVTDQPERQIAAEIIREKLLHTLNKEVPHGIAIEIFQMEEDENKVSIEANIYCEKQSHKGIIIGKGGEMLKRVGTNARTELERMYDKKVFLSLWVKVNEDWRNKRGKIANFGFDL